MFWGGKIAKFLWYAFNISDIKTPLAIFSFNESRILHSWFSVYLALSFPSTRTLPKTKMQNHVVADLKPCYGTSWKHRSSKNFLSQPWLRLYNMGPAYHASCQIHWS